MSRADEARVKSLQNRSAPRAGERLVSDVANIFFADDSCLTACAYCLGGGSTMADEVSCDIWREQDERTPATLAFCIQREDDPDATPQQVRCWEQHEGQAAVAAALRRCHLAPATVYRTPLRGTSA